MSSFFGAITEYLSEFGTFVVKNFLTIGVKDIIDIAIVTFLIFWVLKFVRNTRTIQLLRGIVFLVFLMFAAQLLDMKATGYLLKSTLGMGVIAIFIVFQPELRKVLERVGTGSMSKIFDATTYKAGSEDMNKTIDETVKAVFNLSRKSVGALIAFEKTSNLNEICRTGVVVDSVVSAPILENIFFPNAPLHDGAVVIRGNKIHAASCVLPLTQYNESMRKELGTRHRAAVGLSETSDSIVIVVSEETSVVSVAVNGILESNYTNASLKDYLERALIMSDKSDKREIRRQKKKDNRQKDDN